MIPLVKYRGKLSRRNATLAEALKELSSSIEFYTPPQAPKRASLYLDRVLQGATIVPRSFWFVRRPLKALVINPKAPQLETDSAIEPQAKEPWKGIRMKGAVEGQFLYATALAEDLMPFGLRMMRPVVLPLLLRSGFGTESANVLIAAKEAAAQGFTNLADWLAKVEREYGKRRKATTTMSLYERLDYDSLLTNQNPTKGYRVLYNRAGTHLAACVVGARSIKKAGGLTVSGFVVDNVAYALATDDAREAHYLAGVLNAPYVDDAIKPYQTRGLFGATSGGGERDIHRRPFEVLAIPKFDSANPVHLQLATLSQECHRRLPGLLSGVSRNVGRARQEVRAKVATQISAIDALVRTLLGAAVSGEASDDPATGRNDGHAQQQELIAP